jgi:hypothetical protein
MKIHRLVLRIAKITFLATFPFLYYSSASANQNSFSYTPPLMMVAENCDNPDMGGWRPPSCDPAATIPAAESQAPYARPENSQPPSGDSYFYVALTPDGNLYTAVATSVGDARQIIQRESGRTINDMMQCGSGWYASWEMRVSSTPQQHSTGAVCGRASKYIAIQEALAVCQERTSLDCHPTLKGEYNSQILVTAFPVTDKLIREFYAHPEDTQESDSYCRVWDGGGISGSCAFKAELTKLGVYFRE